MLALLATCDMSQLLVRGLPETLVKKLKRRAIENGVSAEEEHRRILKAALTAPEPAKKKRSLLEHFLELGRIAPDFELVRDRKNAPPRRKIEF